MITPSPPPHVALLVETSSNYGRRILSGITRYLNSHRPWSIFFRECDLTSEPPTWLRRWRGDGIICRLTDQKLAHRLRRAGIPLVDLNDRWDGEEDLPQIRSDQQAIGQLAAEHLLDRGFRSFAFCGFTGHAWSNERGHGFAERLKQADFDVAHFSSAWYGAGTAPWEQEQERIGRWAQTLPKPVGILCCNDVRGQHLLDACLRRQLAAPEEVAVIGVDNDEVLCQLCNPPLSSIAPNSERLGYEAAELLDRLMVGLRPPPSPRLIEPLGVVTRQSTDVLAISDPDVAAAVRYIRENACQGMTVGDLLARVPIARTVLERRFRKYLGHSPQAEIRAVQLKRAQKLLSETDLPLQRIAALTGYRHAEYFSVVFRRSTGKTPGQHRAEAQARGF